MIDYNVKFEAILSKHAEIEKLLSNQDSLTTAKLVELNKNILN